MIKISFGCTRDFHVIMWESSLFEDKLAGDLGNVIEATSIRRSSVRFFTAGKLASGNLRLFQQHRPNPVLSRVEIPQRSEPLTDPRQLRYAVTDFRVSGSGCNLVK